VLEKAVEAYLNKKVKEAGGLSFKWTSSVAGVPDRILFLSGKVHFVELKTLTGVISPRQKIVFKDLADAGFPVEILNSKETIDGFIQRQTTPIPD